MIHVHEQTLQSVTCSVLIYKYWEPDNDHDDAFAVMSIQAGFMIPYVYFISW